MSGHPLSPWSDLQVCISMPDRPEKWDRFRERFSATGIPVMWFQGLDGRLLTSMSSPVPVGTKTPGCLRMNPGPIGSLMSHLSALTLASMCCPGERGATIFEDDASPTPDFRERLAAFDPPDDWDILMLGYRVPPEARRRGSFRTYRITRGVLRLAFAVDTHAYLVRGGTASRVVEAMMARVRGGQSVNWYDQMLADLMGELVVYAPEEPIFTQEKGVFPSDNMGRGVPPSGRWST